MLRHRLFLLAAAAMLPVAVMSAIALAVLFEQQRAQGERTALEITRALSTALDAELQRTVSSLETLAIGVDPANLEASREAMTRTARNHKWANVLTSAVDGTQVLNTRVPKGMPLPSPNEWATVVETAKTGRPVIAPLVKGKTAGYVVPVRVPVIRDGATKLVLTAGVTPESLLDVINRQRFEAGWVMTALDQGGTRVLRWPRPAEFVAAPLTGTLKDLLQDGRTEGTGLTRSAEGWPVVTAYSRSPLTGWTVAVGIPKAQVEAASWASLRTYGTGLAISLLVGALLSLVIARSINRPMAQLAAGQPVASGIREVREVAEALGAAAREREAAERDREELLRREQAARAAAESANRAKDEFLAMLGHELRNPLGAVSNAAHVLQAPAIGEQARKSASGVILRQIEHLTRLVDDLLDAARALMGKIMLRRAPIDVAAAAAQSIATLRSSGRLQRHALAESLEPVWADVDAIRLDQVICNLLVNAAKYTPDGGHIAVDVRREGAEAVIRVADDGIGLSPELAARAFDLFVQGDRDLDRAQGGLGIGLTLVRRLAELHGGSATVESEGPGKGSTFIVRLPAIEAPAGTAPGDAQPAAPGRREIILIEDNEDARATLKMLLEASGHRVDTAGDGVDGLSKAARGDYDVALVDIGLPGMDGYEVARGLKAAGTGAFLVALTGYGLPEDRRRALEAGFDAHLVKPVDPRQLEELLAAMR